MTRLFVEGIGERALKESGAQVVVIYGQVTDVGAAVLGAWEQQGEADEERLRDAFAAPKMLDQSDPAHFAGDVNANPLIDTDYAREKGLKSAALFRLEMKNQVLVAAFGFTSARDFARCGPHLYNLAARMSQLVSSTEWGYESLTVLAEAMDGIPHALEESTSSLSDVLANIGGVLHRAFDHWKLKAHSSFWVLTYEPSAEDGQVVPRLHWKQGFGPLLPQQSPRQPAFGEGLIGWVAKHRVTVNVLPKTGEKLPLGGNVDDYYIPWDPRTRTELAVPLIYQNNLVGVLNIESPTPRRFAPDVVLLASAVAAQAAQVIHQQRLEQFYTQFLGVEDLKQLGRAIVHEVGQFIEAPLSSIYLWDIQDQCLRLEAASAPMFDAEGAKIEPGKDCCPHSGVGFVRWAFENRMRLRINDIPAFNDPAHRGHQAQREEVEEQIWDQGTAGNEAEFDVVTRDGRRFFRFPSNPGDSASRPEREVPEPIWSDDCHPSERDLGAQITIPILDPLLDRAAALGVMCFARRQGDRPFSNHDVNLLQGVACQVAHTIARSREQQSQDLEKSLISEVVTMEPGSWETEFQRRLEGRLKRIRSVTGAHLVIVRARHGEHELSYVASSPTDQELSRQQRQELRIPRVAYFGTGGSGRAAAEREPVHMASAEDFRLRENLGAAGLAPEEERFLKSIQSEAAVPLFSRGAVIGTITAISFAPSSERVHREGDRWLSDQQGIQPHHIALLEFHARWLGPALETIKQIVRNERQLSSLSIATRELTALVTQGASADRLIFASLVVATHGGGLRFHQAMVADCDRGEARRDGAILLRPKEDFAWGCMAFQEQHEAHEHSNSLETDLRNALFNREPYCDSIRKAWQTFDPCEWRGISPGPCLVLRHLEGASAAPPRGRIARPFLAEPGSDAEHLLDAFCDFFGIARQSAAGRKMCVGMVPLGRANDGGPASVLFVTNVVFHRPREDDPERASIGNLPCESVDAVQELAHILELAEAGARAGHGSPGALAPHPAAAPGGGEAVAPPPATPTAAGSRAD